MHFRTQHPKQSLNKAYLKQKVGRSAIELFKNNFEILIEKINPTETEEHLKNIISDFLKDTWYKDRYEINTKGRNDLVIHSGKSTKDPVGVIIEVKRPSNTGEMFRENELNVKAIHELVLYYLRERIDYKNIDIKYLIVTNIYEWFIMDEVWFENNIFRNQKLRKDYDSWLMSGKDTKFFYENVAKPALELIDDLPTCTYFNIKDYEKSLLKPVTKEDKNLIALYKILSPTHLLKAPFVNDSNKLDESFYQELLYIIGLEEKKVSNKWLIKQKEKPLAASILENAIIKIENKDCLYDVKNLTNYGNNRKDQLFNIALELSITWVNRILFLKLLEGQLYRYHKSNPEYLFLNANVIYDFNELNNLFFQILAERIVDRKSYLNHVFEKVPYLNSSLFERIDLERQTIDIGALDNRLELPLYPDTVLKDIKGKKRTGLIKNIDYLFEFLSAYDFTSEGAEDIQEENKNLINASVLGLIFEKINGYKDGSFYTPGFVTMYMCRQTVRKGIVNKFNKIEGWNCHTITDVYNKIEDKVKANKIINDEFTICDPAVGSGHFLVSALNEIIAVKSELKILSDRNGKTLRDYHVEVVNDELLILNEDGTIFEYNPESIESKRVQEALFHEKEIIIENCLFGVDINENSVKICRLRLWIELLKNAYYKDTSFRELETLPNIDINIKCGNSLISRFELDDDLKSSLKKIELSLDDYKEAVKKYKRTKSRAEKNNCIQIIDKIKGSFKSSLDEKFLAKIAKARGNITKIESEINTKINWNDQISTDLENKLKKAKITFDKAALEKEDILNNVVYRNCFEWRFEFPEVLGLDTQFIGFDIIIGNPPWGAELEKKALQLIKNENSDIIVRMIDSFMFFVNKAFSLKNEQGIISMIIPDVLLYQLDNEKLRKKILEKGQLVEVINLGDNIFSGVARASAIVIIGSNKNNLTQIGNYRKKLGLSLDEINLQVVNTEIYSDLPYSLFATEHIEDYRILTQLDGVPLYELVDEDGIQRGVSPDLKEAFIVDDVIVNSFSLEKDKIRKTITGGSDLKKFIITDKSKRLIYTSGKDNSKDIPYIIDYVGRFRGSITCKEVIAGKHPFWSLHRERNEAIFQKNEKILGVITSDKIIVALDTERFYPTDGLYVLAAKEGFANKYLLAILNSRVATFIYRLLSFEEGRAMAQIKPSILKDIPVPEISIDQQQPFVTLVDYLIFLSQIDTAPILSHTANDRIAVTIEEILNMMVYELYFDKHLKDAKIDVLAFINPKSIASEMDEEKTAQIVSDFYIWYQAPENPVRQRMILADTRSTDIIFKIKNSKT